MNTESLKQNTEVETSDLVSVELLFFHPSTELADIPFNIVTHFYHSLFGVDTSAYHVLVVIGSYAYEVQTGGTCCTKVENLDLSGLMARWHTQVDYDKAISIARYLQRQVDQKRKLQLWESARYFLQVWHHRAMQLGFEDDVLVPTLDEGTAVGYDKVLFYNLPYTCASMASEVLTILYPDLDLGYLAHLPSYLYPMVIALTVAGDEGAMEIYG